MNQYQLLKSPREFMQDEDKRWLVALKDGKWRPCCGALKHQPSYEGERCVSFPLDNGRCRLHGGHAPRGAAHYNHKGKGYSKYLPTKLADRYNVAASDGDLLSLNSEAALLTVRIGELLERLDAGEGEYLIVRMRRVWRAMLEAQSIGDRPAELDAKNQMDTLIEEGENDYAVWAQLQQVIESRRKVVESEQKRLIALEQMIPAERAMVMIGRISAIVKKHVKEPATLTAIATDIGAILTSGTPVVIEG